MNKPNYVSLRALNLLILAILPPLATGVIGLYSGKYLYLIICLVVGACISYRLFLCHLWERIIIKNDELIFIKPFSNKFRFKIADINTIYVLPYSTRFGNGYIVSINSEPDKIIKLKSKNSFELYGAWYHNDIYKLFHLLKIRNKKIKAAKIVGDTS